MRSPIETRAAPEPSVNCLNRKLKAAGRQNVSPNIYVAAETNLDLPEPSGIDRGIPRSIWLLDVRLLFYAAPHDVRMSG